MPKISETTLQLAEWRPGPALDLVVAASGFSAQNQRWLHYGLGAARTVDRVVIQWPSGTRQTIATPAVDMRHRIKEPDGE